MEMIILEGTVVEEVSPPMNTRGPEHGKHHPTSTGVCVCVCVCDHVALVCRGALLGAHWEYGTQ